MMRTLRTRLILSHILPLLIILPVLGIVLSYLLETQVILSGISNELSQDGLLTAAEAGELPEIWSTPSEAQGFVRRYSGYHRAQVSLLDAQGNLIASSMVNSVDQPGQPLEIPNLSEIAAAETPVQIIYSVEFIEAFAPIVDANQQIVGAVRITQQLNEVNDQFLQLRYFIIGAFLVALVASVAIGLFFALRLGHYLQHVTTAIYGVTTGREWKTLPEKGPEEIRLLLRAFNSLIERLQSLEDSRRRLLANMVHEIGRPVGAMQSAIHALLSGGDQDPAFRRELLEGMSDQTKRLMPLLDNLAELHGQVLGTFKLDVQPVDLDIWLPRVIATWREAARAEKLTWQENIADTLPVVEIDSNRVAQAIGNLLGNAIKYTPNGGTVTLDVNPKDDGVSISVSDTGPGIPQEEQEQIFKPFYRSHHDRRFPQGMGLGLTIAHDIIAAHSGTLQVESTSGQGSRFTIWLPEKVI